jgi:hypothetical protein
MTRERDPIDHYLTLCACQLIENGRQWDAEVGEYLYFCEKCGIRE